MSDYRTSEEEMREWNQHITETWLADDNPYSVKFDHAESYDWFYTRVLYNDEMIARKGCCKNYVRAARWARRRIRNHHKALAILGGEK